MHLVIDWQQPGVPDSLVVRIHGSADILFGKGLDGLKHLRLRLIAGVGELLLANLSLNALDKRNNLLVGLMSCHDAIVHILVRDLVGASLNHGNALTGRGHGHSHLGNLPLGRGGVNHVLAVNQAHRDPGDRAVPGNIRDGEGNGGAHHCGDFRRAVLVRRHDGADDRHVVAHILWEQRADRPVNHPAGEDGLLAGAAFPL